MSDPRQDGASNVYNTPMSGATPAPRLPTTASVPVDASSELIGAAVASHGFVVIRGFLSGEALAEVQCEAARAAEELPGKIPAGHVMYDDAALPSTLKQIQQLWQHDDFFGKLMERLQSVAEAALGEGATPKKCGASRTAHSSALSSLAASRPRSWRSMQYFNKPPVSAYSASSTCASSRPTPPHQDGYYFLLQPPGQAVTMWLALDAADEENGCLRYVLGSAHDAPAPRPHGFSGVMGAPRRIAAAGTAHHCPRAAPTACTRGLTRGLLSRPCKQASRSSCSTTAARTPRAS